MFPADEIARLGARTGQQKPEVLPQPRLPDYFGTGILPVHTFEVAGLLIEPDRAEGGFNHSDLGRGRVQAGIPGMVGAIVGDTDVLSLKIFHGEGNLALSRRVPLLENLGFNVLSERTFSILKPDVTRRNLTGAVNATTTIDIGSINSERARTIASKPDLSRR